MKLKSIFMLIVLMAFVVSAVNAVQVSVTRDVPDSALINENIDINLNVDVNEADKPGTYILTEYVPAGFEVVDSGGGHWFEDTRTIKWLVIDNFMGQVVEDTVYTYTIKTPVSGTYEMNGTIQTATEFYIVQGDTQLTVSNGGGDSESPVVGAISPTSGTTGQAQTYSVDVSDNVGVVSCNLYVDGSNVGAMNVPCLLYTSPSPRD